MTTNRILIADGDKESLQEHVKLFVDREYPVEGTGLASEAVALVEERPFGCAIVDVALEDGSGLDAILMLRRADQHLRVVVTAQENSRELEAEVRKHDVVYYYVKSFDREELLQAAARAIGGRTREQKARILVVDDDREYQLAVRQILESSDYEVTSAYSKDEGLAAAREFKPDLIILDVMMAHSTDGFHFLYGLKNGIEGWKPPVLSVSVIAKATGMRFSPTGRDEYFPVDDFLSKPIEPMELLHRVQALLGGYRAPAFN